MKKQVHRKSQSKKNNSLIWGLVALFVLGLAGVWFSRQGTAETGSYPREISVEEAAAKREAGAFILDVRQPEEWNEFHIPDATLIPLGELEARVQEVPQDQEIVVVCRSGNRSATGRDILRDEGLERVT